MSLFSLSKSTFEAKLAGKLQERFINISRRNKLLARWAFEQTKLPKTMRDEYVYDIVKAFIFVPSDTRLIMNIVKDLTNRGIAVEREDVVRQLRKIEHKLNIFRFGSLNGKK